MSLLTAYSEVGDLENIKKVCFMIINHVSSPESPDIFIAIAK